MLEMVATVTEDGPVVAMMQALIRMSRRCLLARLTENTVMINTGMVRTTMKTTEPTMAPAIIAISFSGGNRITIIIIVHGNAVAVR